VLQGANLFGDLLLTFLLDEHTIVITNIYLNTGSKNLIINNIEYSYLPQVVFPYTLEPEQSLEMRLSCITTASEFARLISGGQIAPSTKIRVLVSDTTGGEHFHNTGFTALQFSNYRN